MNLQSMVVGGVVAPLEGRPNGPRLCSLAATKASAARSAPAAAPVVVVVPLVSATRRPTVLHAHHVRDGRPASTRQPVLILDPTAAPAEDLSTLYAQRWEVETIFDELKTHQRGPKVVLRSKTCLLYTLTLPTIYSV